MARSRRAARARQQDPTPPKPPAEPSAPVKQEVSEPPVSYKRLGINLVLLVIICLETGLMWRAQPVWVTRLMVFLSLLSTIWGVVAAFVFSWVLALLGAERKKLEAKQRAFLQNPRLTFWLAGGALVLTVPAALAAPWVFDPPPLLWVLPQGVYNDMTVAQDASDSGFRYLFKIEQGGRSLTDKEEGEVVTGRGSLYVGRNPKRQLAWIGKSAQEELERYSRNAEVLAKWRGRKLRKLIEAPVRKGCAELVLEYCAGGRCEEITRQPVKVAPKLNRIFLDRKHDSCPL